MPCYHAFCLHLQARSPVYGAPALQQPPSPAQVRGHAARTSTPSTPPNAPAGSSASPNAEPAAHASTTYTAQPTGPRSFTHPAAAHFNSFLPIPSSPPTADPRSTSSSLSLSPRRSSDAHTRTWAAADPYSAPSSPRLATLSASRTNVAPGPTAAKLLTPAASRPMRPAPLQPLELIRTLPRVEVTQAGLRPSQVLSGFSSPNSPVAQSTKPIAGSGPEEMAAAIATMRSARTSRSTISAGGAPPPPTPFDQLLLTHMSGEPSVTHLVNNHSPHVAHDTWRYHGEAVDLVRGPTEAQEHSGGPLRRSQSYSPRSWAGRASRGLEQRSLGGGDLNGGGGGGSPRAGRDCPVLRARPFSPPRWGRYGEEPGSPGGHAQARAERDLERAAAICSPRAGMDSPGRSQSYSPPRWGRYRHEPGSGADGPQARAEHDSGTAAAHLQPQSPRASPGGGGARGRGAGSTRSPGPGSGLRRSRSYSPPRRGRYGMGDDPWVRQPARAAGGGGGPSREVTAITRQLMTALDDTVTRLKQLPGGGGGGGGGGGDMRAAAISPVRSNMAVHRAPASPVASPSVVRVLRLTPQATGAATRARSPPPRTPMPAPVRGAVDADIQSPVTGLLHKGLPYQQHQRLGSSPHASPTCPTKADSTHVELQTRPYGPVENVRKTTGPGAELATVAAVDAAASRPGGDYTSQGRAQSALELHSSGLTAVGFDTWQAGPVGGRQLSPVKVRPSAGSESMGSSSHSSAVQLREVQGAAGPVENVAAPTGRLQTAPRPVPFSGATGLATLAANAAAAASAAGVPAAASGKAAGRPRLAPVSAITGAFLSALRQGPTESWSSHGAPPPPATPGMPHSTTTFQSTAASAKIPRPSSPPRPPAPPPHPTTSTTAAAVAPASATAPRAASPLRYQLRTTSVPTADGVDNIQPGSIPPPPRQPTAPASTPPQAAPASHDAGVPAGQATHVPQRLSLEALLQGLVTGPGLKTAQAQGSSGGVSSSSSRSALGPSASLSGSVGAGKQALQSSVHSGPRMGAATFTGTVVERRGAMLGIGEGAAAGSATAAAGSVISPLTAEALLSIDRQGSRCVGPCTRACYNERNVPAPAAIEFASHQRQHQDEVARRSRLQVRLNWPQGRGPRGQFIALGTGA